MKEAEIKAVTAIKQIDEGARSFKANGTEYFIENLISVERYREFQKMELEVSFQQGFYGIFQNMKTIYEKAQKGLIADIAVIAHNCINGLSAIDKRRDACFTMCALFINEKNEDRTVINDQMIEKKINDWSREGIDTVFFLTLAANLVRGFIPVYREIFQNTLEKEMAEAKMDTLSKMQGE